MSRSGSPTNLRLAKKLSDRLIVRRDNGCWEVRSTPHDGFDYKGIELYPYEFAWISFAKANRSPEWWFSHVAPMPSCNNIMCVNPRHCAGGKGKSLEEKLAKTLLGGRNRNYPLQPDEIEDIKQMRGYDVTPEELGEQLGVSDQTIRKIWLEDREKKASYVGVDSKDGN